MLNRSFNDEVLEEELLKYLQEPATWNYIYQRLAYNTDFDLQKALKSLRNKKLIVEDVDKKCTLYRTLDPVELVRRKCVKK